MFKELNANIKDSEITAIIGKNGSGKTSIMDMIFGIETNFNGEIKIGKSAISKKNVLNIRNSIGYIRQNYDQDLFNVNVLEDIKYGSSNIDIKKLNELLESFGLNEKILDECYIDLSSGEKKKILIIKLLLSNKAIFLIDDVTKGLDSKSISTLVRLLKNEKRAGKIIVLTSTNSDFLLSVADSFIILENKELKIYSNKYDVFTDERLLDSTKMCMPNVVNFKILAQNKGIKLLYRDNINDLMKDIYRNAK